MNCYFGGAVDSPILDRTTFLAACDRPRFPPCAMTRAQPNG